MSRVLNLFYQEPECDRWLPYDRFPRRLIRRLVRGRPKIGGHGRVFLNLCAGLERIGVPYRVNAFRHIQRHQDEMACIIGKHFLLDEIDWKNRILYGAAVCSHPIDDLRMFERKPIARVLVPGPWMKRMFDPYWGPRVEIWPVGIDTELWKPVANEPEFDVLLYDKVRWEHEHYENVLIDPIRLELQRCGRSVREIRYGFYREEEFRAAMQQCRTMIFICEHETQGIAYQQALSCGIPIFAWDRRGYWQDPAYYPELVKFAPVTSTPYWDSRCGKHFADAEGFVKGWDGFWANVLAGQFKPRDYILENLTLEKCALDYVHIVEALLGTTVV